MAKIQRCNAIWIGIAVVAAGLLLYWVLAGRQDGSFMPMNVRATEHQLIAHTACAQLAKQQPSAAPLCHQLFPAGRYPLPRGIADQPKLIPKNFADQYEADEPLITYPMNWNEKSNAWTMDLTQTDGFSAAASFQSQNRTPTWREVWWNPGAIQNSRTGLNDNLRVRPRI